MATVLNRTTKQLILSANTPDFPLASWIIGPDLSAVNGQPSRYWVITGDVVTLMDAPSQAAVDAALLAAARDGTAAILDGAEALDRAFALTLLDELNAHSTCVTALFAAIAAATSLANLQTRAAAISALPQRSLSQLKTALRAKLGT